MLCLGFYRRSRIKSYHFLFATKKMFFISPDPDTTTTFYYKLSKLAIGAAQLAIFITLHKFMITQKINLVLITFIQTIQSIHSKTQIGVHCLNSVLNQWYQFVYAMKFVFIKNLRKNLLIDFCIIVLNFQLGYVNAIFLNFQHISIQRGISKVYEKCLKN